MGTVIASAARHEYNKNYKSSNNYYEHDEDFIVVKKRRGGGGHFGGNSSDETFRKFVPPRMRKSTQL